jgi:hypothetical protein
MAASLPCSDKLVNSSTLPSAGAMRSVLARSHLTSFSSLSRYVLELQPSLQASARKEGLLNTYDVSFLRATG